MITGSVKLDDQTISITTQQVVEATMPYTVDLLLSQRNAIQQQKDADNARRDAEIAEVNSLLAECAKQGLKIPV